MRVAQVMAGAPVGGAELFFERLNLALTRAGETVLPVIRRNPARAARLRAGGLETVELAFGAVDLLTGLRLRAVLRGFAPRVTVAWMSRAAQFAPRGEWVLTGRLGGYYDLRYYRRCDHLIANTRGLVDWIIAHGWPAARVHYLPNFVPDLAGAVPASRADLGVPPGVPLVLALGRLHRDKAFDVLIRALPRLPRAHAVIAGDGPERAALLGLARAEGVTERLHLIGWRGNVAELLAAADVLACPSRVEPLGNVVIEGWSARRSVVAAASDGPRELIDDGVNGMLVPAEDAVALADALHLMLEDAARARVMAETAYAYYQAKFAEAPVLGQWRDFLARVEKS
jgi:glycosyltransferase involved in cell wall biosynthesis